MTILGLFFLTMIVMKCWPETAGARWLHTILVELPLARIARMERRHLIFLVILILSAESFAMAGLLDFAAAAGYAMDLSFYVDALLLTWTVAAVTRLRVGAQAGAQRMQRIARTLLARPLTRARARRRKTRPTIRRRPANDDERPAAVIPLAVAA